MNELKINDIKSLVNIPDYSIYIYILLCIIGFLIVLLFIFLIYKFFKNKKKNIRKEYFSELKNLDLNNTKESAYTITKYVRLLASNEREKNIANALIEELKEYKYKKEVPSLSHEVKMHFERFMDTVDV